MMRILAVGAFSVPVVHENWREPLRHLYGDDVVCVDANPFLARFGIDYLEQYLYRRVIRDRFDYLFFYPFRIYSDFSDAFFERLRAAGVRSLTFHPDDEPEVWYRRSIRYDHRFDLVASHSRNGVRRREEEGRAGCCRYLPWGYNPRFFRPAEGTAEKRYDIVFIGKHKVYDRDGAVYQEDGRERESALALLAAESERRGWRFGLFGHGWERHPTLGRFAGGALSQPAMVALYQQSKIVFNPAWSSDPGAAPQTKLRHFEVPGCGAFQVTNWNPELADLLEAGREVVFYRDDGELLDVVTRYLTDDEARERIARAGWWRVSREHTIDQRLRRLFAWADELWPARHGGHALHVVRYPLTDRMEMTALLGRLKRGEERIPACDLVHFVEAAAGAVTSDYGGLVPEVTAAGDLFGVRTFLEVGGCADNPVLPSREESRVDLLAEVIEWRELGRAARRSLRRSPSSIHEDGRSYWLSNFVARPAAAVALLEAFVEDSVTALLALDPRFTGAVVNTRVVEATADEQGAGPRYFERLCRVLDKAARLGERAVIYGGRGEMAAWAMRAAAEAGGSTVVAVVDNAVAGGSIEGFPVIAGDALASLEPALIVIAAAHSGPAIRHQLEAFEGCAAIVPLYDLDDPAWGVLLP